jgi:Putative beta-barrel porin 2
MKKLTGILFVIVLSLYTTAHLYAAMEITPRLSIGTEYTDNVRLVPDNTESDFISTITPGITFDLSGRVAGLALSYDPSWVDYYDDSYEDYWRHAANLEGWWQSGRNTRFDITNQFLKTEDPISDDDLTIRRTRNPYTRNTANIRVEQQFGAENTAYAAFEHSILENEDPTIDDSQEYVPSIGLTYWMNVRWGIDLTGVFRRAAYDVPEPALPNDFDSIYGSLRLLHRFNRQFTGFLGYAHTNLDYEYSDEELFPLYDFTIHDGFIGFDYNIDSTTLVSLSGHYFIRDLEDGSDDSGTPINLDFTKSFQRGNVGINAGGGYNYTVVSSENLGYYKFYGGGLNADYQFARRITGDIYGLYEWRDYQDVPLGREDDIFRAGCGLSFEILRWLTMRAGYLYRTVDSTDDLNDYKENRVSLLFTLQPPQPYRVGQ